MGQKYIHPDTMAVVVPVCFNRTRSSSEGLWRCRNLVSLVVVGIDGYHTICRTTNAARLNITCQCQTQRQPVSLTGLVTLS